MGSVVVATKMCSRCGKSLPLECFTLQKTGGGGLRPHCRDCERVRYRAYRKDNPEMVARISARQLARRAGVEEHEIDTWYEQRLKEQNDRCAMPDCQRSEKENGRRFAIDHDHRTGKPRALLCTRCNRNLGIYELRHKVFDAYLRRYK